MKIFVLLACLSAALAFEVDYDNLVPIYETDEWLAVNSEWAPFVLAKRNAIEIETTRSGRVWSGRTAEPGELPYQVGIVVLLSRQGYCGGSIVSNNFVLTAASCFPGDPNAVVEIGSVDRNTVPEFINAAQKILHPQFDSSTSNNDIALVRLVRPVVFNNNIRAVRLPNRRQVTQTFENQMGRVSGFGATGTGDSSPNRFLRVGFSPIISQLACRVRFPNSSSDRTLCIEGVTAQVCNGDFGGPLTIQDADEITTQIGVASFISPLGCTREFPGGFTRVSMYLEWIGQNSDVVIRDSF